MLNELEIRDFAIIDHLQIRLGPGFVVFTGETGAGKSIMIDAVMLLVGGRAEAAMIRTGAEAAWVEGVFELSGRPAARALLEAEGLLDDPERATLGRELRREGRNICRVNGRTVSLTTLRALGELLVDVHGQSEHLSLLRVREHQDLLDRFAQTADLLQGYRQAYDDLRAVQAELEGLRRSAREAAQRQDLLSFQVNEIEAAALRPGELEALHDERVRLANAEQLARLAEQAIAALDEEIDGSPPASDRLGLAAEALRALAQIDGSQDAAHAEAQVLVEQAGDLARRLRLYREAIEFNPRRLDEVEERLALIRSLERKYGPGIEAVLEHAQSARLELDTIVHAGERQEALEARQAQGLARLGALGARLSEARRAAGDRLAAAVERELADLRMTGARFAVQLDWDDDPQGATVGERRVAFGPGGLDRVEFLIAPNPGEGLKPLVKTASGGETSRLMLGLKGVLARADHTPTLIFDEIDQGIGGRVGAIVGRKLRRLSDSHQVLCITHLPQLAAYGALHFRVEKQLRGGRTVTTVGPMTPEQRIEELAQMLGGTSPANRSSAAELLQAAAGESA
jgi:DNA repair protein RecN (Recombination protein N)